MSALLGALATILTLLIQWTDTPRLVVWVEHDPWPTTVQPADRSSRRDIIRIRNVGRRPLDWRVVGLPPLEIRLADGQPILVTGFTHVRWDGFPATPDNQLVANAGQRNTIARVAVDRLNPNEVVSVAIEHGSSRKAIRVSGSLTDQRIRAAFTVHPLLAIGSFFSLGLVAGVVVKTTVLPRCAKKQNWKISCGSLDELDGLTFSLNMFVIPMVVAGIAITVAHFSGIPLNLPSRLGWTIAWQITATIGLMWLTMSICASRLAADAMAKAELDTMKSTAGRCEPKPTSGAVS